MRLIALHDLLEVSDRFGEPVLRAGDAAKLIVSIQLFVIDFDRALKALTRLVQFAALLMNQAQIVMRGRITRIDRCSFQVLFESRPRSLIADDAAKVTTQ